VISVTGLLGPLSFQPTGSTYRTETSIEGPLFAPGAAIAVTAPGDEVPGFSVSAVGVVPFDEEIDLITIEDDVDTEVTWTAASSGRVQLALRLGWHGGPCTDMILCEADDTAGSLVIAGELVTQFPYPSRMTWTGCLSGSGTVWPHSQPTLSPGPAPWPHSAATT